jgi:ABC-2 type transport system ATP-binding protein
MLQRLGLAQALLHSPPLVILDEPMSGLDPLGRGLVRDVILSLKNDGTTVLFSSHVLPDVETLCDRVVIIAGGVVVAQGAVADLSAEADPDFEIVAQGVAPRTVARIEASGGAVRAAGERTIIRTEDRAAMNRVVGEILASGAELIGVSPRRSPLETTFLKALEGVGTPMHDGAAREQGASSRGRFEEPAAPTGTTDS